MRLRFIPRADGQFDAWQTNFVAYAAKNGAALGLDAEEIAKLESFQSQWDAHYAASEQQQALASAAVADKTNTRAEFEARLRSTAREIQSRATTTDAERGALGITIPDRVPTPIPAPTSQPILTIDVSQRLRHLIHFADEHTPTRRAKPRGAACIQIWTAIRAPGAPTPTDPAEFTFTQLATRTPTTITLDPADAGKTAAYIARWTSPKAETGPWSNITMATVGV
jgi:hypothetical protein